MATDSKKAKNSVIESKELSGDDIQDFLQGKAFKIYWYLLINGETGVRELQRQLGFSSPNIVTHHIKKLVEAELVWQNPVHGKYEVKQEVKTGILTLYLRVGRFLIPQQVFLLVFFFTMVISYVLLILVPRGAIIVEDIFFLVIAITGIVFIIRQAIKVWQLKPL
ncbi:MAG: hypothetical protein ACFFD4_03620 [Candidatus Odinarchaeota archaeon]